MEKCANRFFQQADHKHRVSNSLSFYVLSNQGKAKSADKGNKKGKETKEKKEGKDESHAQSMDESKDGDSDSDFGGVHVKFTPYTASAAGVFSFDCLLCLNQTSPYQNNY